MFGRDQFYQASSEQSALRQPKSLPKALGGISIKQPTQSTTQSSPTTTSPCTSSKVSPKKQNRAPQIKMQCYIPGLNSANDPCVMVPVNSATQRYLPKEISAAFVESFLDGTKQPISALMEYCTSIKIVAIFEECSVERPSILSKFAIRVKANGKPFPQGIGKTKKEAKTSAAKIALNMLLGLGEDGIDEEDDETASISKASILTSNTFEPQVALPRVEEAGVRPLWDPPIHPVSRFTEYCACNAFSLYWKVSDTPTDIGFKAEVFVNEDQVSEGFAPNKKDAKKKAAENAIQKMCPENLSSVLNSESTKPSKPQPLMSWTAPALHQPQPQTLPASRAPPGGHVKNQQGSSQKWVCPVDVCPTPRSRGGSETSLNVNGVSSTLAHDSTKADSSTRSADETLSDLTRQAPEIPQRPCLENESFHNCIATVAHYMFDTLLKPTEEKPAEHPYLAAFIIRKGNGDVGQVVALGTGNTCTPNEARSTSGRVLNDCHYAVIAHRALLKYIHRELKQYFTQGPSRSIFELLDGTKLLTFKQGITIHLYLSRAPCGDIARYTTEPDGPLTTADTEVMDNAMHYPDFPDDHAGYTSTKHEKGFVVSLANEEAPKWGNMSCSDKILKWNTVGLQGALFGHFLGPLYLSSITMGSMYNHGSLSRAVSARLTEDIISYLPGGYHVNYPHLGRVTHCDPGRVQHHVSKESINWSFGDEKIEIVNGSRGISCRRSPFRTCEKGSSRVCKAGFLFRFREIASISGNKHLLEIPTYAGCKAESRQYQKAKRTLIEHLELTGFGFWVHKQPGFEVFKK